MKTRLLLAATALLFISSPAFAAKAAKAAAVPRKPLPSVQLRRLIDSTLPKISNLAGANAVGNRTNLTMAQADFAAEAQAAPVAERAMYQAANGTMAALIGAVDEHDKAVANFHYSKDVHGPQDTKDAEISSTHRGWGSGRTAEANNAKQNKENADSRKELLEKEKFLSKGSLETWTVRAGQLRAAVEQAYTSELVAEKQMVAARPPVIAVVKPPAPKPAEPPKKEASAAEEYSPVGTWAGPGNNIELREDNTFTRGGGGGTWAWTNQSKGELDLNYKNRGVSKGVFSTDGQALEVTPPNGKPLKFSRAH